MSLAIVYTRAQNGIHAPLVSVETHLSNGLPGLSIVGLPETAVKESKDRVRGALLNSRFEFPARRITINLAPADLPKDGSRFDLPIALGILAASGQIRADALHAYEFVGELALSGMLRRIPGALPVAIHCKRDARRLVLPIQNAAEAALVSDLEVLPANSLLEICSHLNDGQPLEISPIPETSRSSPRYEDLCDVRGQYHAKRALEIAAAGRHSLLMFGPPGTGKSMLAMRLPGILPPMTEEEALETAAIRSISGQELQIEEWRRRPFRAPHHTASGVALVGGGSFPRPGEISLAHNGVVFLDELPEFDRKVLEVLREPLESGKITISRAARQADFPARFQLIAAMNPCPCGYLGHPSGRCQCNSEKILRYRSRISGPLLDRIDMHVEVPSLPLSQIQDKEETDGINSASVRECVVAAHDRQLQRGHGSNNQLTSAQIRECCQLDVGDEKLLEQAIDKFGLSARARDRILKVSRTIADLDGQESILTRHLTEALSYRQMDRTPANC